MHHDSRLLRAILIVLALVPGALMFACILAYGVDVPWHDEWLAIGPLFEKSSLGTLGLFDLTAQHNEHRIFFPKLVCLALGAAGRWDVRREMWATLFIAAATAWNVRALLKTTVRGSSTRVLALFLLSSLLIFSPVQWGNWLMGMQMALFVPPLCMTTALRLVHSRRPVWVLVIVCMLLCTISTFSVGSGVLCWVVILPPLLSNPGSSTAGRKAIVALWSAGLASNIALYVYGYVVPQGQPTFSFALAHPLESFEYFAAFLGSPFASTFGESSLPTAVVLGSLLLFLFGACCLRFLRAGGAELSRSLQWISIGAYAILTAVMTTLARVGAASPVAERYATFSVWLGVSTVALLSMLLDLGPGRWNPLRASAARSACGGLLAIVALVPWPASLHSMKDARTNHLYGKACMQFAGVVDNLPGLRVLLKRSADLRDQIGLVDRGGFLSPGLVQSPFAQDIAGDPSAECGTFQDLEHRGAALVASGRAQLPWRGESPDAILLAYDRPNEGSTIFAVCMATMPGESASVHGGAPWSASFGAAELPPDTTSISAWAFDALRGKAFRLSGSPALR